MKKYEPQAGERILHIFYCHGCQSCLRMNEEGTELLPWKPRHVLGIEDITDDVKSVATSLRLMEEGQDPYTQQLADKLFKEPT